MSRHSFSGRYEVLEVAGSGGMATVWRGYVTGAAGFKRPVAIKRIIPALLNNEESLQMFIEEARVGSQLHHPNIVQIFDFGRDEQGAYFLVMEWVDGLDLRAYRRFFEELHRQLTPWRLVTAIDIEALRALDAAHRRIDNDGRPAPVIHRDVTPQNILLGSNGVVKLTDFGLARAMDRARMTHPDIVKGKLGYLAPELSYGRPATVRSDLFSLGVVLWETLAGRPLYEGETDVDIFMAARKADIPPPTVRRNDLPAALVQTVMRALSRNAADRFANAREMMLELTALLRTVPEPTDAPVLSQSFVEAIRGLHDAEPREPRSDLPATSAQSGPDRPPPPKAKAKAKG